jgi:hypothetical protein
MYCIDCGKELPVGACFCAYCGRRVPAGTTPEPESGREGEATGRPLSPQRVETAVRVPPEAPTWVGWVGFGLFILGLVSFLLPWLVFSYWCYRRGRYEGTSLAEDVEPPLPYFPARLAGWLLASIFLPIVGWFTAVHVPTLCYQQGLRAGACERESEDKAEEWAPGLVQMAVVVALVTLAVWIAVGSLAYVALATNGDKQATTAPSVPQSPTPLTGQDLKDVCASWLRQAISAGATTVSTFAECVKCGGPEFMAVDGEWVQEPWPHAILYAHCVTPTPFTWDKWDEWSDPTWSACLALAKTIPEFPMDEYFFVFDCYNCGGPPRVFVDEKGNVSCREPSNSEPSNSGPIDWSKIPSSE